MVELSRLVLGFCVAVVAALPQVSETARRVHGFVVGGVNGTVRQQASETAPREWIDPATGHRVLRLSDAPGSASLYFHQNQYTGDGDKMVFSTREGLSTVNLRTLKIEPIVEGRAAKSSSERRPVRSFT